MYKYYAVSDVYVFEESQTWEKSIPPLPTARFYPTTFAYKSTLVVIGGVTHWNTDSAHSTRTSAVEVFRSKSSQWYCAEPLPLAHSSMTPAIINDTCYLIGGTTGSASRQAYCTSVPSLIETAVPPDHLEGASTIFQILSSPPTWQVLPDCPFCSSTAAELGGCLLAIGGKDDSDSPSSAVHVYSPSTNSWVRISSGDLPVARYFAATTQLTTGEIIFVGGKGKQNYTARVFTASIELWGTVCTSPIGTHPQYYIFTQCLWTNWWPVNSPVQTQYICFAHLYTHFHAHPLHSHTSWLYGLMLLLLFLYVTSHATEHKLFASLLILLLLLFSSCQFTSVLSECQYSISRQADLHNCNLVFAVTWIIYFA